MLVYVFYASLSSGCRLSSSLLPGVFRSIEHRHPPLADRPLPEKQRWQQDYAYREHKDSRTDNDAVALGGHAVVHDDGDDDANVHVCDNRNHSHDGSDPSGLYHPPQKGWQYPDRVY